jgi:ATP-dependent helicase/nuclease subunit B
MAERGLLEVAVAPHAASEQLARDLLQHHAAAMPDLSGAVVILPNLHAASALARTLATQAGRTALLPRLTTLAAWCNGGPGFPPPRPAALREAELFGALRQRNWLDASDLWQMSAELIRLFDDLTRHGVRLPVSGQAFLEELEDAYQARAGEPMQFEARLVHELWHAAAAQSGDQHLDPVALYQMQLARIASEASRPLYAAGLPALTPAERNFFEEYARRAPVFLYRDDALAVDGKATTRFYAAAWPAQDEPATDLRDRARSFSERFPHSPVTSSDAARPANHLTLFAANSLEQEARAVETQVRRWLHEGCQSIAVVALDRLVARRTRALLERAGILVEDETGWLFSTTSAATAVMRWLDAHSSEFHHQDLLDLIKSPFIFADWPRRREAVHRLERIIRRESVVAGLDDYLAAARAAENGELAVELLERLRKAARLFPRDRPRALHHWLLLLSGSLKALGMDQGLRQDPAGLQLLELLEGRLRELTQDDTPFSLGEWRQWLSRQLENAEFRDTGITSPVAFMHLASTRLRAFDAVALVGCDDTHLPGPGEDHVFFNQSVRRQLGLPTAEQRLAQVREDLIGLLSRSPEVLVTWQSLKNSEPNLVSPLFERLQVFHELAWKRDLMDRGLGPLLAACEVAPPEAPSADVPLPAVTERPAPSLRPELVPQKISASGYNSVLACPYQFFARYALRLREPDEVREVLEKRDYGEYVHRILRRFHERYPETVGVARSDLEEALVEISNRVFRDATEADYLSHAWALRWRALISSYVDWQLKRERHGWRFHAGELAASIEVTLPGGGTITLEGRIDRVDEHDVEGTKTYAVLDYKARNPKVLREGLADTGEDVQLAVYMQLLGLPVEDALYLSVDKSVEEVQLDDDAFDEAPRAVERLGRIFAMLRQGSAMPAQGVDQICRWCEMRGLCRKNYWA